MTDWEESWGQCKRQKEVPKIASLGIVSDIGVTVLANCQYRGDKTSIALVYLRPRLSSAVLQAKKVFSTDNI